jgi:hypothetical protein
VESCLDIRVIGEDFFQNRFIGNISPVKDAPAGKLDPSGNQRINDDGGVTRVFQR